MLCSFRTYEVCHVFQLLHCWNEHQSNVELSRILPALEMNDIGTLLVSGGTERATSKSVLKLMGIQGLTLFHLKSHLQDFRVFNQELGLILKLRDMMIV
uniref:Uncharacterized protein n=1 Tax=Lactuca sativa TaxID=4236 RepID=A0A9R1WPJ7_LACSA|nr:hypothetical protein LSAT_V11C100016310 [Lactuca sativa]